MLRKLMIATIAVVFTWLAALPALANDPQQFAIRGADAGGSYSGQLTLTKQADGTFRAVRRATYDNGAQSLVLTGTLTADGQELKGTLAPDGMSGALQDRASSELTLRVSPDGQTCEGTDSGSFKGKTFASNEGLLQFLNDPHTTADQLAEASGIEAWRAGKILAAGQKDAFGDLGDVDAVRGVGEITMGKLRELVDPAGTADREAKILAFLNNPESSVADLRRGTGLGLKRSRLIMAGAPFGDLDEVDAIKGIGPVTMQKLRDFDFSALTDDGTTAGPTLPPLDPDPVLPGHEPSGETFAGYTIYDFDPAKELNNVNAAYRVAVDWQTSDQFKTRLEALLAHPRIHMVKAIVIGYSGDDHTLADARDLLVQNAARLGNVEALFFGDIDYEEAEISWIENTDIGPLVAALPNLRTLKARGGMGLGFSGGFTHSKLESITVESGGTDTSTLRELAALNLPAAKSIKIWIGTEEYGASSDATATVNALKPFLTAERFPKLEVLGLMNSDFSDAIAEAVAGARVLDQLKTLDLSMGTLGDDGAAHLVASDKIKQLQTLNLDHHYMSQDMAARMANLSPVQVSVDEPNFDPSDPDYRYVAVGE